MNEGKRAPKPQVAGSIPVPPAHILRSLTVTAKCREFTFARDLAHYLCFHEPIFLGLQQTGDPSHLSLVFASLPAHVNRFAG